MSQQRLSCRFRACDAGDPLTSETEPRDQPPSKKSKFNGDDTLCEQSAGETHFPEYEAGRICRSIGRCEEGATAVWKSSLIFSLSLVAHMVREAAHPSTTGGANAASA